MSVFISFITWLSVLNYPSKIVFFKWSLERTHFGEHCAIKVCRMPLAEVYKEGYRGIRV